MKNLSEKEKKAAQIVQPQPRRRWSDEEKKLIVDYLVLPENWSRIRMNVMGLCVEVRMYILK